MKLRRLGSALAAVAFATVLAVAVPSTANAATYTPPVTPIPDVPSRTIAMVKTGGTWSDLKAVEMWRAMSDFVTKPGNTLATLPKPITPPAQFVRGAAGGPLVGAFLGGFAIGTTGLSVYGAITGTDPLESICGTGFEGVSQVLYMGMMPDCTAGVSQENADQAAAWSLDLGSYGSFRKVWRSSGVGYYTCSTAMAPLSGAAFFFEGSGGYGSMAYTTSGNWDTAYGYCGSPSPGLYQTYTLAAQTITKIQVKALPGGAVLAEGTPVQTRPDPVRKPSCRISWEDGTSTVGTGRSYTESQGLPLSASGLGCEQAYVSKPGAGPELMPDKITVESEDDAGAKTTIADQDVPDMSPDQRKGLTADNGKGLILEKTNDGGTESCNTWAADCSNWWTKTDSGTKPDTEEGTYRCTFGGKVLELIECGPYRKTFDTKTDKPTVTDPETGEQAPWTNESPGNSTNPGAGPTPGDACMTEWASVANPIEWVLQPIKCAFVWAFIPRADVALQAQTAIAEAWEPTMVGQLPGIVSTAVAIPNGGTGCTGPHVVIPIHLGELDTGYDGYPLSACDAPFDVLATWARVIGSAVLIWLTGLGIIRRASSVVNAPGLGGGTA